MRLEALVRVLFALYCVEAGILLTVVPWTAIWDRAWIVVPVSLLRQALLSPWGRGAVTGFGLIHLVWGSHELAAGLRRGAEARDPAPSGIARNR